MPGPEPAVSSASATARWRSRRRGGEQPAIRDVADPIVGEVQLVPHGLEHVVANHLLDRLRRVALVHAAGGWRSVKSNRRPMTAATAASCWLRALSRSSRRATRSRTRAGRASAPVPREPRPQALLIEGAHRLHGDEGIALAHGPDLLLHVRHRRGVAPDAGERAAPAGRCRRVTAARARPASPGTRGTAPPAVRRAIAAIGELFFARGDDQERRPRRNAATHEGQQAETHLVGPVHVLQHEHQGLPGGDLLDEPGHALEQGQGTVARAAAGRPCPPRAAGGSTRPAAWGAGRRGSPRRR